jgi:tripartite ATP-independent transporter DctP family solute receptor
MMRHPLAICAFGAALVTAGGDVLAQDHTIRFASALVPEINHSRSMVLFKEEVEQNSDGRIAVELFFSGALGGTRELLDQVKTGTIQMSVATTGFMTNFVPKLGVLNLPFLYESREAALAVLDGPFGEEIDEMVGAVGFKALGFEEVGWRHSINRVRPIETVKDMEGLKIRLQPIKVHLDTYELMGAIPVAMDFKELYTALQQGVIDGLEVNYQNMHDQRFHEVSEYVTELPLFFDFLGRWMNRDFWDGLPADLQAVVEEASAKAVAFQRSLASQENEEAREKMIAAGVTYNRVSEAELARFREVTAPVYAKYEPEFGQELIESIRQQ